MTRIAIVVVSVAAIAACQQREPGGREPLRWSGWVEEAALHRGYIKPGDIVQFGCPPGWIGVDDTTVASRAQNTSAAYMGTDPRPREGTISCVAQKEFQLPPPYESADPDRDPVHRPLTPLWVNVGVDSTTIVFRQEVPSAAALYIGQDTPCGPRLIGVRLGDLLKWLADPHSTPTRDFLGLVSAGCPEQGRP